MAVIKDDEGTDIPVHAESAADGEFFLVSRDRMMGVLIEGYHVLSHRYPIDLPIEPLLILARAMRTQRIASAPPREVYLAYLDFCLTHDMHTLGRLMVAAIAPSAATEHLREAFMWASKFDDVGSASIIIARAHEIHEAGDRHAYPRIDPAGPGFTAAVADELRASWVFAMGNVQRDIEKMHNWRVQWCSRAMWADWATRFVRCVKST